MKFRATVVATAFGLATAYPTVDIEGRAPGGTPGMDVSAYQKDVDWAAARANGAQFAYIKATEGTYYNNAYFTQQYDGSYNVGMIRGSYHFAIPDTATGSGAEQANYFIQHGGGWSKDGKTLPGALDIEYNPNNKKEECYTLSKPQMVAWIHSFVNEYHAKTTRYPVIYTTTDWWTTCTGNSDAFASTCPLWIADPNGNSGKLPAGWTYYTFWQWAASGVFPGDQDVFNGAVSRLKVLATG